MAGALSTKETLLALLTDVEILSKDLFEKAGAEQSNENERRVNQVLSVLVEKDEAIKSALNTASDQARIQEKLESLRIVAEKKTIEVLALQKCLKEAEGTLANAIFEAKKKIESVHRAEERKIPAEELIKYAHKISASAAVAAPPSWSPGDLQRPYPTDVEMRQGMLAKNFATLTSEQLAAPSQPVDPYHMHDPAPSTTPSSVGHIGMWAAGGTSDFRHPSSSSQHSYSGLDMLKEPEPEYMSSADSSSSSSSDE